MRRLEQASGTEALRRRWLVVPPSSGIGLCGTLADEVPVTAPDQPLLLLYRGLATWQQTQIFESIVSAELADGWRLVPHVTITPRPEGMDLIER